MTRLQCPKCKAKKGTWKARRNNRWEGIYRHGTKGMYCIKNNIQCPGKFCNRHAYLMAHTRPSIFKLVLTSSLHTYINQYL